MHKFISNENTDFLQLRDWLVAWTSHTAHEIGRSFWTPISHTPISDAGQTSSIASNLNLTMKVEDEFQAWSSLPASHLTQVYDRLACSFLASQFINLQLVFSFSKFLGCAKQIAKNGDGS